MASRLLLFFPTLLLASLTIFLVMRVLPGDVALTVLSGSGEVSHDIEQIEQIREELGLNDPLATQYGKWLASLAKGEFGGRSLEDRTPIGSLIAHQLPVTLQLTIYTLLTSLLISVPLGVAAALNQNKWPDYLIRITTITGQALPSFFVALMTILGLLTIFKWSPPLVYSHIWDKPWNHFQMLVWPVLILAWGYSAFLTRITRASFLEVMGQDYIRTARAKGLSMRLIVWRHALRNSLIPIISVGALQLGGLVSGVVVLETIFGIPGVGRGIVEAAVARDYPVIQSLATLLVLLMLIVNLVTDLLYKVIDPRVSFAT